MATSGTQSSTSQEDNTTYGTIPLEDVNISAKRVNPLVGNDLQSQIPVERQKELIQEVNKDPNKYLPEKQKGLGERLYNAAKAGVGQLGSIVSSIPSGTIDSYGRMNPTNQGLLGGLGQVADFLKEIKVSDKDGKAYQYFAGVFNALPNGFKATKENLKPIMDASDFGKITEKYTGLPEEFNPLSPNNAAANYFKDVQKRNHEKTQGSYKGGIWQAIKDGKYAEAGKLTATGAVESIPLMLGLAASRGAGLSGNATLAALGVGTAENEYEQLKEANPNIDKNLLLMNAQLTGLGEAGSELLGFNMLYDQGKKLFLKGAKEEAENLIKTGLKSYLNTAFKKSFVGSATLSDAAGEMSNQLWKNAIDKWSGVDPNRDYTDGVMDAGIISLASTGGIAAGVQGLSKVINPKVKATVAQDTQKLEQLGSEIENPNLPEEAKNALREEVANTTEKINDTIDKEAKKYDSFSEEDKVKANTLNNSIEKLTESMNDVTSTQAKDLFKKMIQEQEAELAKIKPTEEVKPTEALIEPTETETSLNQPKIGDTVGYNLNNESLTGKLKEVKENGDYVITKPDGTDYTTKTLETIKTHSNETNEQPVPKVENVEEVSTPKTEETGTKAGEESVKELSNKTDKELNDRWEYLEDKLRDPSNKKEFNAIDKELEIRERNKIFNKTLSDAEKEIDNLISKKDLGVYAEPSDLRESKKIISKYSNPNKITESDIKNDFSDALRGNPTTSYSDGLKLRESMKLASERGIDVNDLLETVEKIYTDENVPKDQAKSVVIRMLNEVFKDAKIARKEIENVNTPNEPIVGGEAKVDAEVVQPTSNDKGGNGTKAETVAEEKPKEVSGIKKALVSDEIIEGVNLEKISDKAMQDLGKSLIETGEINPKAIVDEIAGIKKSKGVEAVEGSKRALQPKEVVSLIHYKTTLDNKRRELLSESNKLAAEGKSTTTVDAELSGVMDDINAYDTMAVITAQQQSLAFRLRKGLLDKDYNLVTQVEQYKKVNGGEIPADVLKKFQALDKELTELKEKIAEAEKKAQEATEQKAIDNIVQDVERTSKTRKSSLSPTEQARKKELAKKYRVFNDISRMVTLIAEKDFREYARLVLKEAKGDFQAFAVEILKTLGVDAKKYLPKLYNELGGKGKVDMENLIEKPFVKDGELVIPNAYIRDLVNEGIKDINKLSEEVLKVVEKDLPDATLRQVRDAITKYGREVNQTADDVTRSINEAKRLGRLYSQLEDLANQKKKAKTAKKANEISKEEKELKRQVKLLEDRLPKTQDEIDIAEQKRVNSAIAATERAIVDTQERITNGELEREVNNVPETQELAEARERLKEEQAKLRELQENAGIIEKRRTEARKKQLAKFIQEKQGRLANKNFAPREKAKPLVEDAELQALQVEANRVRNEYDEAHYQNEQENRPQSQKIYDAAIGWGTGIQRTLQAGLDDSAFGVQGVIAVMSQNPAKTIEAIRQSAKFLVSEKYEAEYFNRLKAAPDFNEMKESGLALNYPNSKLGTRDYQLQGSEINKIWKYLVATPFKAFGESTYERVLAFNPYRATERSFTGAIDTLRVQMFREFTNLLKQDGITIESNPEQYKLAATTVNNMTFRGRLRNLEPIAKELSVVFFAPRKIAATLAMTNPYYWGDMWVKSPTVAKRATLKMASFIGLATTLALAIKAFKDDEDEDSNPDMLNPISPDFMKAKIGNTRLDFFGGLNQNLILFSRMFTNEYKTSTSSKVSKLGENSFVPTRAELGARFLTNKFAPTASLLYKWADQGAGRQIDWDDEALKGITPIWTQNIKELYKEHPATMATFLTSLAFFGQNMSTYGGAKFLEKGKDDKIKELFDKKGASFSDKTRSSIEVIDPSTTEKRGITKDEFTEYKKVYGDFIKGEVKSKYKTLEDMPVEEFESEMKKIKSNATDAAKEAISGIDEDMLKMVKDGETYKLNAEQLQERIKLNNEFEKKYESSKPKYVRYFMRKNKVSEEVATKMAEKKLKSLANSYSRGKMIKDVVNNK